MDQVASNQSPEGLPHPKRAEVVMRLRSKILGDNDFAKDFESLMGLLPEVVKQYPDIRTALQMEAIKRMHIDLAFIDEVERFMNFAEQSTTWTQGRKFALETGVRTKVKQVVKPAESNDDARMEFLKELLVDGFTLDAEKYSRRAEIIRRELFDAKTRAKQKNPPRITPVQMIGYYHRIPSLAKTISRSNLEDIRLKASKLKIYFEEFKEAEETLLNKQGYLLTEDNFALVIDLDHLQIEYQFMRS